jgi:cytochrome c
MTLPAAAVRAAVAVALAASSVRAGAAAAAQDDAGARAFQRCYSCHSVKPEETGLQGPNLYGVVGRRAGSLPGFEFSEAMTAAGRDGLVWTPETLDAYLADPRRFLPGNAMAFFGLKDSGERQDVIRYLQAAEGRGE